MADTDSSRRFLFADADVRGSFVHLDSSYKSIVSPHQYPESVGTVLGEFLVAAILLSGTLKFEGRLTLQVKSDGPIKLLMAEATHDGKTRGIVQLVEGSQPDGDFAQLFAGGILAVTIEPNGRERYQSLVPLQGKSLSACLEHYFMQSEQLGTVIHLAADQRQASGIMLQQLPGQMILDPKLREHHWQNIVVLGHTLTRDELLELGSEEILRRLFAAENIDLLTERPVSFACSCSEQRMASALISLGNEELEQLFVATPNVELTCEFCGDSYEFDVQSLTLWMKGDEPKH